MKTDQNYQTHEPEPLDPAGALIPSISIDALLAARDAGQAALRECRRLLDEADEQLKVFGISLPPVSVEFSSYDRANIQDRTLVHEIEREVDRHVWLRLFQATNIDTLMDHKTRAELFEKLERRSSRYGHRRGEREELPELTRENIAATIGAVHAQQGEFFDKCIEAVYRSLSWEHKTNEPTRIGEKLIVTGVIDTWARALPRSTVNLRHHESLHDLERVLCLLDGLPPSVHGVGLRSLGEIPYGEWVDVPSPAGPEAPPLMRIKVFRKGTAHVRITKQKHVDEMNLRMARRFPGAIPPPREAAAAAQKGQAQRPRPCSLAKTDQQARQSFYTPEELADELVLAAGIPDYGPVRVLEPSAGEGALVRAVLRRRNCGSPTRVVAIENDPHGIEMLGHLALRVNEREEERDPVVRLHDGDFFDVRPDANFDAVVMNPPFSNAAEVEHVLHAWGFVKPGGVLVSVMSNGATFRKDGRYGVLRKFFAQHEAEIRPLPAGSFEESGTAVATVMVVIRKPAAVECAVAI